MNNHTSSKIRAKPSDPKYKIVKNWILERISNGQYQPGDRIASEFELVAELGHSRMTVNRAMRELRSEGVLDRVAGVGSFVAEAPQQSSHIEVNDIADEIIARGHVHTNKVVLLKEQEATKAARIALMLTKGERVYHSILVHYENGVPIQVENRYILASFAKNYTQQDFTKTTPYQYLLSSGPITEVEHIIESTLPDKTVGTLLGMNEGDSCLLLTRRTWTGEVVVTYSKFYYPAKTYKLASRYTVNDRPR